MTLPQIFGEFRVAGDIDLRYSSGGTAYARFRAVADKKKKEGDQWVDDKVFWVNVTVFGKTAENMMDSVARGDLVYIEGTIETREYEKDGQKRTSVDVIANRVGASLSRSPVAATVSDGNSGAATTQSAQPAGDPWGAPAGQKAPF